MTWTMHPISELDGDWNRLARGNPYYDSAFVDACLKHFGTGKERLCVHRTDGLVDGMLIVTPGPYLKWQVFCPSQAQIAPTLASSDALTSLKLGIGIDFLKQDPDWSPIKEGQRHALTMRIHLDSFERYWETRSANLRSNISRKVKRSQGRLVEITDPSKMADSIQRFASLEQAGWKGQAGTAVSGTQQTFYTDVMQRFADKDAGTAWEFYVEDKIAAIQLNLHSSEMCLLLKTTFDETMKDQAPGRVLQYLVIQKEFERRRSRTYEFYTSAEGNDQALAWGDEQRWIVHRTAWRWPFIASLVDALPKSQSKNTAIAD